MAQARAARLTGPIVLLSAFTGLDALPIDGNAVSGEALLGGLLPPLDLENGVRQMAKDGGKGQVVAKGVAGLQPRRIRNLPPIQHMSAWGPCIVTIYASDGQATGNFSTTTSLQLDWLGKLVSSIRYKDCKQVFDPLLLVTWM